jgi:hypothetical protein
MKKKILRISAQLFLQLFTEGIKSAYKVTDNPLPDDCIIIGVKYDPVGYVDVYLHSEEFDIVNEKEPIPFMVVVIQTI